MIKNLFTILFTVLLVSCAAKSAYAPSASSKGFEPADAGSRSSPAQRANSSETPADTRMVTYTVQLDLSVKNSGETRTALVERVKSDKGFIVRETEHTIVTRVPAQNMDNFLKYARTLGDVEHEAKTGVDITDQYRDNVARLNNLKAVRDRYMALLEMADSVTGIMWQD